MIGQAVQSGMDNFIVLSRTCVHCGNTSMADMAFPKLLFVSSLSAVGILSIIDGEAKNI